MLEGNDNPSVKEMNHLALGLCAGILAGLLLGNLALGIVFGIAMNGMLDVWEAGRRI